MVEILEVLEKLNPWWTKKDFESGITREKYLEKIKTYLKPKEILILTGVRRAGKTTLLFQTIKYLIQKGVEPKQILFVNFDEADISNLETPISDVLKVYYQDIGDNKKPAFLIFDEIQNVAQWEKWAKTIYDEKRNQLIISGSSSHLLDDKLANLISGRYLKINVFPLDFGEYLKFKEVNFKDKLEVVANKNSILKLLRQYLSEGGFPKIVLEKNADLKREILKTYHESIVYRDVLLMHNVRQKRLMRELIYYLISNFTCLYSYKKISGLLSADFSTLKEYFSYLEESKAFFELSLFSYSLKTQSRNNKKIYFIDNGLRNAVSFKFSKDEGKLAENLVFVELKRQDKEIYYWQNAKKQEVDFIIKNKDQSLTAINISYTNKIENREFESLSEFKKQFKKCNKLILLTKDIEKKENGIFFIPFWKWLLGMS